MTKIVPEVEPPELTKPALGECPHCAKPIDGFRIEASSHEDVLITLSPCGCVSHSSDGRFKSFADLVKTTGCL